MLREKSIFVCRLALSFPIQQYTSFASLMNIEYVIVQWKMNIMGVELSCFTGTIDYKWDRNSAHMPLAVVLVFRCKQQLPEFIQVRCGAAPDIGNLIYIGEIHFHFPPSKFPPSACDPLIIAIKMALKVKMQLISRRWMVINAKKEKRNWNWNVWKR